MSSYFIYKGTKYIVALEDKKIKIYKSVDNKQVDLTQEEKEEKVL